LANEAATGYPDRKLKITRKELPSHSVPYLVDTLSGKGQLGSNSEQQISPSPEKEIVPKASIYKIPCAEPGIKLPPQMI